MSDWSWDSLEEYNRRLDARAEAFRAQMDKMWASILEKMGAPHTACCPMCEGKGTVQVVKGR